MKYNLAFSIILAINSLIITNLKAETETKLPFTPRIINGVPVNPIGAPIVKLLIGDSVGKISLCTGTVIAAKTILTAGHCVTTAIQIAAVMNGDQVFNVIKVARHPQYKRLSNGALINDLAILTLSQPVPANIPFIALSNSAPKKNQTLYVYGYGLDNNKQNGYLQGGEIKVYAIDKNIIAALFQNSPSNTCNGDSGGPLINITRSSGVPVATQHGVTSFGDKDCLKSGFYSRTDTPVAKRFIKRNSL